MCAPEAGDQSIAPCWNTAACPRPSGSVTTSDTGYPSAEFSQPTAAHASRTAPRTTCAPDAGDQYTDPPWKCANRPPAANGSTSVTGYPSTPDPPPAAFHPASTSPASTCTPPAEDHTSPPANS